MQEKLIVRMLWFPGPGGKKSPCQLWSDFQGYSEFRAQRAETKAVKWRIRRKDKPMTEQKKAKRLNILSIPTQQSLLLGILITLNNLINMFQNLFLPLDGGLLILEPLRFTPRLYSSRRFLGPSLVVLAFDEFVLLFLCEPGVIAVTEHVGILARVACDEGARDVRVVEKGVPEGFDEFGLVEFEVAEALDAVGLWFVLV